MSRRLIVPIRTLAALQAASSHQRSYIMSPKKAPVATPLSRKAVLVSVNISQWTARKLDKKVTDETNQRHNATEDAGRYNKLLIAAEHLKTLNSLVSRARALHYSMTRPWADDGPRILPNVLYTKFANEFRTLQREFAAAADAFCAGYPKFIAERKAKLNGMFNEADYPKVSDIRSKFNLDLTVLPFPDVADFRADIDDETMDDLRREITQSTSGVVDKAMEATASEIIETVGHMAEKLKEYGTAKEGERKFFLDSLVGNVRELAELLPAFNLTGDPKLDKIVDRIKRELCVEEAATLRKDAKARAVVQKSADQIVAEVSKLFG